MRLMKFRGLVTEEVTLREIFARLCEGLGYEILRSRNTFPDYELLRKEDGKL